MPSNRSLNIPWNLLRACLALLLWLCVPQPPLKAQQYAYRNYTTSDGLPGNTVYRLMQDKRGFIWAVTENGVSRFDGYGFRNFGLEEGLPDLEVLNLAQDSKDRIWFLTYSGAPAYYDPVEDRIIGPSEDDDLRKADVGSALTHFFEDSQHRIWLGSTEGKVACISADRTEVFDFDAPAVNSVRGFWERRGEVLVALRSQPTDSSRRHNGLRAIYSKSATSLELSWAFRNTDAEGVDQYYLLLGTVLYRVESDSLQIVRRIAGPSQGWSPTAFHEESAGRFLIGLRDGRIFRFTGEGIYTDQNDPEELPLRTGKAVTSVITGLEGDLWVSTLGEGIYVVNTRALILGKNVDFGCISEWNGSIITGAISPGGLGFIQNLHLRAHASLQPGSGVQSVACDSAFLYEGSVSQGVRAISLSYGLGQAIDGAYPSWRGITSAEERFQPTIYSFPEAGAVKKVSLDGGGRLWVASGKGLFRLDSLRTGEGRLNMLLNRRMRTVFVDQKDTVWFAGLTGLYRYHADRPKGERVIPETDSMQVTCVAEFGRDTLVFGTHGRGVWMISPDRRELQQLEVPGFRICRNIRVSGREILVSTTEGVLQLRLSAGEWKPRTYTLADGLPGLPVNDAMLRNDTLWIATTKGLGFMPVALRRGEFHPVVYFTRITVGEEEWPLNKLEKMPSWSETSLDVEFTALSLHSEGKLFYRYRLIGLDSNWHYTQSRSVNYSYLPAGTYTLEVQGRSTEGDWTGESATLSFRIRRPFYRTWWFSLLIITGVAGVLVLFLMYRFRARTRRERLNRKLLESEQLALRAQMNPHFIFNTLNNIQFLINMDEKLAANTYLSKFARLVRSTLDNSRKICITLAEEVEMLRLFLDLEALRFKERIRFRILTTQLPRRPEEYRIPSMLIQPFVENAIRHGLLNRLVGGNLVISFREEGESLICMVEDDGIGRKEAGRLNSARTLKRKSVGSDITFGRIVLLNQRYGGGFSAEIEDLFDENGKAAGTRVYIHVPLSWNPDKEPNNQNHE